MSEDQKNSKEDDHRSPWWKSVFACIVIALLAAGVTKWIFSTEPKAVREGDTRKSAMLVEVTRAEGGFFRPVITVMGSVVPAREIILSPRVSGEIVERSPGFVPGGFVKKGEMLLKIDPADFEHAVAQRMSDLKRAEADLEMEMGRQNIARQDFKLLDRTLSQENEKLILRKPQLSAARAAVDFARAVLTRAELDLQRTQIKAPFDAHVLSRHAHEGSQVSPGSDLGRLVGIDTYWVELTVPPSKLKWLSFPEGSGETGSAVRLRNRTVWPKGVHRTGHLYKRIGLLEERTRLARVLVEVQDPLCRTEANAEALPLMIGSFLAADIQADPLEGVVRLKRETIRKNDTVWIMKEGALHIREVEVVFRDAEHAYIKSGLTEDEDVVVTPLSSVVEGARLRRVGSKAEPPEALSP